MQVALVVIQSSLLSLNELNAKLSQGWKMASSTAMPPSESALNSPACLVVLERNAGPTDIVRWEPTDLEVSSACLSFDHGYGLLSQEERASLEFQAREWLHAWRKELESRQ